MTLNKPIHEMVSVIALAIAIAALPYSVGVCHAGLALLSVNWLFENEWERKWTTIKKNIILWPFILFFSIHLVGLLYSEDISNGLFNAEKKTSIVLLPVILSTTAIRSSYVKLLLKVFIVSCFIAVIICLVTAFAHAIRPNQSTPIFDHSNYEIFKQLNPEHSAWWSHFSYTALSSAIGIHPTYLGLYIVFSIALLFFFLKPEEDAISSLQKTGITALILLFSLFIFLLSSRAMLIAYLVVCFAGLIRIFNKNIKSTASVIILLFTGALVVIFANPVSRFRFAQEFTIAPLAIESDKLYTTSSSIRFSLWWLGIESINNHNWIMGNGTGDVIHTMERTATKYDMTNTIHSNDPHNQFLYSFLALGIVGLISLMSCLVPSLYQGSLPGSFLLRCFIVTVVIACMTESVFELQKGIVFFSLFQSLLLFHLQPSHLIQLKWSHA